MTDGEKLLKLARTRIGQKYVNVLVPKNNPDWSGPWDCAEFTSWLVWQIGGFLYGCTDPAGDPALTEAYTGAWQSDSATRGIRVPVAQAAATPGAFLLRYPPAPGKMGHIAVSDGEGHTVEAMGTAFGVRAGKVAGRVWDTGVLIPGFTYEAGAGVALPPLTTVIYRIGASGMKPAITRRIQTALANLGFSPGPIDGEFGPNTAAAVQAFQAAKGLIRDGQVGPQTAKALKISLK